MNQEREILENKLAQIDESIAQKKRILFLAQISDGHIRSIEAKPEDFLNDPIGITAKLSADIIERRDTQARLDDLKTAAYRPDGNNSYKFIDFTEEKIYRNVGKKLFYIMGIRMIDPNIDQHEQFFSLLKQNQTQYCIDMLETGSIKITKGLIKNVIVYERANADGRYIILDYLIKLGSVNWFLFQFPENHRNMKEIGIWDLAAEDANAAASKLRIFIGLIKSPYIGHFQWFVYSQPDMRWESFHMKSLQQAIFVAEFFKESVIKTLNDESGSYASLEHLMGCKSRGDVEDTVAGDEQQDSFRRMLSSFKEKYVMCRASYEDIKDIVVDERQAFLRLALSSLKEKYIMGLAKCNPDVFDYLVDTFDEYILPNTKKCDHRFISQPDDHSIILNTIKVDGIDKCKLCDVVNRTIYIIPTKKAFKDEISMAPLITLARIRGNVRLVHHIEMRMIQA